MIEFLRAAETCAHPTPQFGCRGCIDRDRESAIRDFYRTAPAPDCLRHGRMTGAVGDRAAMTVTYECIQCDETEEVPVL